MFFFIRIQKLIPLSRILRICKFPNSASSHHSDQNSDNSDQNSHTSHENSHNSDENCDSTKRQKASKPLSLQAFFFVCFARFSYTTKKSRNTVLQVPGVRKLPLFSLLKFGKTSDHDKRLSSKRTGIAAA